VTDQASYRQTNRAAWVNFQVFPSERLELFSNTLWNAGKSTISDYNNDPSKLLAPPPGLDFVMMSSAFASFSDLQIGHLIQSLGLNYRASDRVVFNAALEYNNYDDRSPWLYDTTGRRVGFYAGVNWIF